MADVLSIVAIICKRYYVEVILNVMGVIEYGNKTYWKTEKRCDELIEENKGKVL